MIQSVLFDLFETLVTERNASVRRASSLAAELGVTRMPTDSAGAPVVSMSFWDDAPSGKP